VRLIRLARIWRLLSNVVCLFILNWSYHTNYFGYAKPLLTGCQGWLEGAKPLFLLSPPLLVPRCTKGKTFVHTFALTLYKKNRETRLSNPQGRLQLMPWSLNQPSCSVGQDGFFLHY